MTDKNTDDEESIFQEKYKVHPTELKLVKNTIDQLDIVLKILNNDDVKPYSIHEIKFYVVIQKLNIPDKDLQLAIEKLCDDKHALLVENYDNRLLSKTYKITYLGRFFFDSVSRKYVAQPYKYSSAIRKRRQIYTIAKIAANIASTLIIIIIGAIGVYVTDKSNKLNQTIEEQRIMAEKQEKKIDSLIKVTIDTTQIKKK